MKENCNAVCEKLEIGAWADRPVGCVTGGGSIRTTVEKDDLTDVKGGNRNTDLACLR